MKYFSRYSTFPPVTMAIRHLGAIFSPAIAPVAGLTLCQTRCYVPEKDESPAYSFEDGTTLSRMAIEKMPAESRSVSHWRILVDWELKKLRPYVIIDPYDPSGLLYLTYNEYVVQARTYARAGTSFVVVARPETIKPAPNSSSNQKTPPFPKYKGRFVESDLFVPSLKSFIDLRNWINRNIKFEAKTRTVSADHSNIIGLVDIWAREVLHLLSVKQPGTKVEGVLPLALHLQKLLKHNGPAFAIKRLKMYLFILNSYVGANPVRSTNDFGLRVALSNGLPAFLPKEVRASIRSMNLDAIRLWASLFNIYKALEGPHKISDLSTVTASAFIPEECGDWDRFREFISSRKPHGFRCTLEALLGRKIPTWNYESGFGTVISSGGANHPHAMLSILRDAVAWGRRGVNNHALAFAKLVGDKKVIDLLKTLHFQGEAVCSIWSATCSYYNGWGVVKHVKDIMYLVSRAGVCKPEEINPDFDSAKVPDEAFLDFKKNGAWPSEAEPVLPAKILRHMDDGAFIRTIRRFIRPWDVIRDHNLNQVAFSWWPRDPILGRLHAIEEAAGKVRIVAICDYFTQILCKGVHDYVFQILRLIPQDGTFDQQNAVDSFAKEGHRDIYSFDLTAATDMIPAQLYTEVLAALIGRPIAEAWMRLLTDRDFLKPQDHMEMQEEDPQKDFSPFVRYGRGQPMGALSSWAGLAIVHHAIVQYASFSAGLELAVAYRVLGDDIVIAGKELADAYLRVCASFGIPVGLYKSLVPKEGKGRGLLNFASQTLLGVDNISPVSYKEVLSAQTWSARLELAKRLCHRYGTKGKSESAAMLRYGCTYPMWNHLRAELSGAVAPFFSRFVRFVLTNPLIKKDLSIDDIVRWLEGVSPIAKGISSTQLGEFESAFKAELVGQIATHWSRLYEGHTVGPSGPSDKPRVEIGWKVGMKHALTRADEYRAMAYWYLHHCYQVQAKAQYRKTQKVYSSVMGPVGFFNPGQTLQVERVQLSALVRAYISIKATPKPIWVTDDNLDYIDKILLSSRMSGGPEDKGTGHSASRGAHTTIVTPKETLAGPVQELTLTIAERWGGLLPIADLAQIPMSRRWWSHVTTALDSFLDKKAIQDASPCHLTMTQWLQSLLPTYYIR
jgi:hypothetical protein